MRRTLLLRVERSAHRPTVIRRLSTPLRRWVEAVEERGTHGVIVRLQVDNVPDYAQAIMKLGKVAELTESLDDIHWTGHTGPLNRELLAIRSPFAGWCKSVDLEREARRPGPRP